MVPHIAKTGWSFKGAGKYYLHDKKADTKERVGWTYTHNIPTNDPEKAMRWMACTSDQAPALKQQAGVAPTGRKIKSGPVYAYSLSWHPEQQPDKQTMLDAALETLGLLKLNEHECVIVNHTDTEHPHVHCIVNLIHPETGKKAVVSYDYLTMSTWAEQVETLEGEIRCPQRQINNRIRREQANENRQLGLVKHKEKKLQRAEHIQKLYSNTSNGHAFQSALELAGYTLAEGHKGRYVVVDKFGEVYGLARQLKSQRAKDLRNKFQDIQNVPNAQELSKQRSQSFDREQYETERQQKIIDAAVEHAKAQKPPNPTELNKQKQVRLPRHTPNPDTEHLRKLDELRAWEQRSDQRRAKLRQMQEEQYRRKELETEIHQAALAVKKAGWFTNKKALQKQLEALEKNLQNMDQRIAEQQQRLEQQITKDHPEHQAKLKQQEAAYNQRIAQHLEHKHKNDKDIGLEY